MTHVISHRCWLQDIKIWRDVRVCLDREGTCQQVVYLVYLKLQVGLSVKGMTFITWYTKTALNLTKQNTLRFLWKQAFERRVAQNNLSVNIRYVKYIMWNISCELCEFIFDVNLCLCVNLHLYLVNCYCLVCYYTSCCIVGGHNFYDSNEVMFHW